jgi:hypothetical protein
MKLVSQCKNSNKIKKNLSTQQERVIDAYGLIRKKALEEQGIPFLSGFVSRLFHKTYSEHHIKTLRQKIGKHLKNDLDIQEIQSLIVTKVQKKNGQEKEIPREWFRCLVTTELILDWFFLSNIYILHENIEFDKIKELFRNEFLRFVHTNQAKKMSSSRRFMTFFTSSIRKLKEYMSELIEGKSDDDYRKAMLLKQEFILKMQEAKKIESEFVKKFNDALENNYQKLQNEYSVDNSEDSVDNSEEKTQKNVDSFKCPENRPLDIVLIDKKSTLDIKTIDPFFKENKYKKNTSKSDKISKEMHKLKFEFFKLDNNTSALRQISKFLVETGVKYYEKCKKTIITKEGERRDIWTTRLYSGKDLYTSDSYKRQIFKHLAFLLKRHKEKFFEFLSLLGIKGLQKYKQLKVFTKKQWYKLIMQGYCKLLYNP